MIMDTISSQLQQELTRQHYRVVGGHSAVKLCTWMKKSIRGEGVCYKQKWYGIASDRCLQMTPWLGCCNKCLFCWRIIEKSTLPEYADKTFITTRVINNAQRRHAALNQGQ